MPLLSDVVFDSMPRRLRGRWPRNRGLWALWSLVIVCAIVMLALATPAWLRVDKQRLGLQAQLMQQTQLAAAREPGAAVAPALDFAQRLPPLPHRLRVLADLQRATAAAGVVLLGVAVAEHPASVQQLARHDYDISLKGPYAGLKHVLAEMLGRHPGASVRSFRWRAGPVGGPAELQLSLAFWSAPLTPSAMSGSAQASVPQQAGR